MFMPEIFQAEWQKNERSLAILFGYQLLSQHYNPAPGLKNKALKQR